MKRSHILRMLCWAASILLLSCTITRGQAQDTTNKDFGLRDGDRVVFYGDSITEQHLYTADVEEYALTRFPAREIAFWNGGVGGDRVSGGWAGPIDLRLHDDVFAFHPTVVTVMLGMNDGMVRPYNQQIFESFSRGYRYLVDQIITNIPRVRLTGLFLQSPESGWEYSTRAHAHYRVTMKFLGCVAPGLAWGQASVGSEIRRIRSPIKLSGRQSVTAPRLLLETSLRYFANTPRLIRVAGGRHLTFRPWNS